LLYCELSSCGINCAKFMPNMSAIVRCDLGYFCSNIYCGLVAR
jgi:hypothetical protein